MGEAKRKKSKQSVQDAGMEAAFKSDDVDALLAHIGPRIKNVYDSTFLINGRATPLIVGALSISAPKCGAYLFYLMHLAGQSTKIVEALQNLESIVLTMQNAGDGALAGQARSFFNTMLRAIAMMSVDEGLDVEISANFPSEWARAKETSASFLLEKKLDEELPEGTDGGRTKRRVDAGL